MPGHGTLEGGFSVADDTTERKFGDLTVQIDRDTCIASANCMKVAPEIFELDDEGICRFKADAPEIERERLIEALSLIHI